MSTVHSPPPKKFTKLSFKDENDREVMELVRHEEDNKSKSQGRNMINQYNVINDNGENQNMCINVDYLMQKMDKLIEEKLKHFASSEDVNKILKEMEHIKNNQLNWDQQLEKLHESKQILDEKINFKVNKLTIDSVSQKNIDDIKNQLSIDLKATNSKMKKELEYLHKLMRKKNIYVRGLNSSSSDRIKTEILQLFKDSLGLGNVSIMNVTTIRKMHNSTLFSAIIQLEAEVNVYEVLRSCFKLKNSQYSIDKDLPKDVRKRRNCLLFIRKIIINNLKMADKVKEDISIKMRDDSLIVNKQIFNWDEENQRLVYKNEDGFKVLSNILGVNFNEEDQISKFLNNNKK